MCFVFRAFAFLACVFFFFPDRLDFFVLLLANFSIKVKKLQMLASMLKCMNSAQVCPAGPILPWKWD